MPESPARTTAITPNRESTHNLHSSVRARCDSSKPNGDQCLRRQNTALRSLAPRHFELTMQFHRHHALVGLISSLLWCAFSRSRRELRLASVWRSGLAWSAPPSFRRCEHVVTRTATRCGDESKQHDDPSQSRQASSKQLMRFMNDLILSEKTEVHDRISSGDRRRTLQGTSRRASRLSHRRYVFPGGSRVDLRESRAG